MKNSKSKGSSFEREICKYLTKWLTGKEKPYVFWRSPSSGAMATIDIKNNNLSGDIISVDPISEFFIKKFSIEIKIGYPDSSFDKHIKSKGSHELTKFWNQCCEGCEDNRQPMLIYKKDRQPILIGINYFLFLKLSKKINKLNNLCSIQMKWDDNHIIFIDFKDFFEICSPEIFKKIKL